MNLSLVPPSGVLGLVTHVVVRHLKGLYVLLVRPLFLRTWIMISLHWLDFFPFVCGGGLNFGVGC